MKATEVRRLAADHDLSTLQAAITALTEDEVETLQIEGDDAGERLTNLLLAAQLRERIDGGDDPKDAFRTLMREVRDMSG